MRATLLPRGAAARFRQRATPKARRPLPTDPVKWATEELRVHLWSKQREILRSIVQNRATMVPACHGPGKSFVAGVAAAYWYAAHERDDVLVITTAPSQDQVKGILWKELGRQHAAAGLPGRLIGLTGGGVAEWWVGPAGAERRVAFGRKPQAHKNVEQAMQAFQGQHATHLLVIIDEATGVPGWLWDAVYSLMTNENARILAIGNPDDPTSRFAKECAPGMGANVIPIPADSTPAFTGEWVPDYVAQNLVSRQWVEEAIRRWGPDAPITQSKVWARFPDTSDDAVITPAMIQAAWSTDLEGGDPGAYGLDVSRFGQDKTALYRVRGGVARLVDEWSKTDTTATTDRLYVRTAHTPYVPIVVDADGLGAGVFDQARRPGLLADGRTRRPAMPVVEFTLNMPAKNPRRFANRRSEMWWGYRELCEARLVDLDPTDLDLAAELQAPKWTQTPSGLIRVETKDELAARGIASPNRADAVIMAQLGTPHDGRPMGTPPPGQQQRVPEHKSITGDLLRKGM